MQLDQPDKPAEHCPNEICRFREGTMAGALTEPVEALSSWWKVAALGTMAAGFAVLILLTVKAYQNAPPIPDKFVDPAGPVVFAADDVIAGQQVFLKHGLMDNGTIWGHGGYLGPDFSAQSLHILALDLADRIARERLSRGYTDLTSEEKAAIDGAVALDLKPIATIQRPERSLCRRVRPNPSTAW